MSLLTLLRPQGGTPPAISLRPCAAPTAGQMMRGRPAGAAGMGRMGRELAAGPDAGSVGRKLSGAPGAGCAGRELATGPDAGSW